MLNLLSTRLNRLMIGKKVIYGVALMLEQMQGFLLHYHRINLAKAIIEFNPAGWSKCKSVIEIVLFTKTVNV